MRILTITILLNLVPLAKTEEIQLVEKYLEGERSECEKAAKAAEAQCKINRDGKEFYYIFNKANRNLLTEIRRTEKQSCEEFGASVLGQCSGSCSGIECLFVGPLNEEKARSITKRVEKKIEPPREEPMQWIKGTGITNTPMTSMAN